MERSYRLSLAPAALLVCGAAASISHAQSVWTGTDGDGLWSTAGNWQPMVVPGMGSNVSIPANAPGCLANVGVDIGSLSAMGGLTIASSLTVHGPSSAVNLFMNPGGSLVNASGAPFTITGISLISGAFTNGTFANSGMMTANNLTVTITTLNNSGTVNIQTLLMAGGGTLANAGTLDFQNEADASGNANINGIRNTSAFKKTGMGTTNISCNFEQFGGTTTVEGGTLKFLNSSSTWSAGTASTAGGGTLRFDSGQHIFSGLTSISGAGIIEIVAGGTTGSPGVQVTSDCVIAGSNTCNLNNTVVRLDAELKNDGNLSLGPNANFTGLSSLHNMPARTILIAGTTSLNGATIINEGALLALAGSISMSGGSTIENREGAVTNLNSSGNIVNNGGGTNQFTNHGELRKTGPGTTNFGGRLRQACGVTIVEEGTLRFTGGGDFVDDVTISSAAEDSTLALLVGDFMFTDAVHIFTGGGDAQFGQIGSSPTFNVTASGGVDLDMDSAGSGHLWISLCSLGGDGLIQQNGRCYCGGGTLGYNDGGVWKLNFTNEGQFICGSPPGENQSGPSIRGGTFTNNGVVFMTTFSSARDGAQVINNNLWIAEEETSSSLSITSPAIFINHGIFRKTQLGSVTVIGPFTNDGSVQIVNGTLTFQNLPELQGGALADAGDWDCGPGTTCTLPSNCTRLTGDTSFRTGSSACPTMRTCSLIDDGASLICNDNFTSTANSCTLSEGGSLTLEDGTTYTCNGNFNNGTSGQSVLSYAEETTVFGIGPPPPGTPRIVTPVLNNRGQIRPGGNGASGPFNLTGNLVCFEESVLQIELGGPVPLSDHDQIAVMGNATIDGSLEVSFLDTFEPQSGDTWIILTATGTLTGGLDQIVAPEPPMGTEWRTTLGSGQVVLHLACRADFDNSGVLSVPDIFAFLSAWFAQQPAADFDGSGQIVVSDIFAFLSAWFAGCGGS